MSLTLHLPFQCVESKTSEDTGPLIHPHHPRSEHHSPALQMAFLLGPVHMKYLQRAKDSQVSILAHDPSSVWALRNPI